MPALQTNTQSPWMTWQPDSLLLQIFEAVQYELTAALAALQQWPENAGDCPDPMLVEHVRHVAALRRAMAALEDVLERQASRILH